MFNEITEIKCKRYVKDEESLSLKCSFYLDTGFCSLPDRFFCEEALRNKIITDTSNIKKSIRRISHSQINRWLTCRYSYWLYYYKNIRTKFEPTYFIEGSVGHFFMEDLLKFRELSVKRVENAMIDRLKGKLYSKKFLQKTILTMYVIVSSLKDYIIKELKITEPFKDTEVEKKFEFTFGDATLIGACDALKNGVLHEHKFASNDYLKLQLRQQVGIYFLVYPEINYCSNNVILKPKIKIKENESYDSFIERLQEKITSNPEEFFIVHKIGRDEINIGRLQDKLIYITHEMIHQAGVEFPALFYSNECNCKSYNSPCEFYDICEKGFVDVKKYSVGRLILDKKPSKMREMLDSDIKDITKNNKNIDSKEKINKIQDKIDLLDESDL